MLKGAVRHHVAEEGEGEGNKRCANAPEEVKGTEGIEAMAPE